MSQTETVTIEAFFADYLRRIKGMYVPGTYRAWRSYATDLHRFLRQQDISTVDELTSNILDRYMVDVTTRHLGSTASAKLTFLNNFAKVLAGKGLTDRNLTEDFTLGYFNIDKNESMRGSNEEGVVKPYLPPEKVRLLWEHAPEPNRFRNQTMLMFAWLTGLRRHEISLTRVEDIEKVPGKPLYQSKVYSRKTKKKPGDGRNRVRMNGEKYTSWTIYFSDSIATQLQMYLDVYRPDFNGSEDSPYLFLTNKSDRMSGNYINEIVKKAAENAGIQRVVGEDALGRTHYHVVAHTIRHSYGTYIANSEESTIKLTQLMYSMGHSDLSTTQLYVHDDQRERRNAFAAHSTSV